jgi:hypothetical protein
MKLFLAFSFHPTLVRLKQHYEKSEETHMENVKADATSYILTVLLQHLETKHPGMLQELVEGVQADQSALSRDTSENGYIGNVFQEALGLLTRAKSLLEIEPQQ